MSLLRYISFGLFALTLLPALSATARAQEYFRPSALYGEWEVEILERKGRRNPSLTYDLRFVITDTTMTLMQRSRAPVTVTYEINPYEIPSYLAWTHHDGDRTQMQRGIFELEGDTLKLCMGAIRCARPQKFATYYFDNSTLFVLKRVLPKAEPRTSLQEWIPLGVFTMAREGETGYLAMVQLLINESGVITGELFDFETQEKRAVKGSVDKESQRAKWTVGKENVMTMETDLSSLTAASGKVSVTQADHPAETWNITFGFIQLSKPNEPPEPLPQPH